VIDRVRSPVGSYLQIVVIVLAAACAGGEGADVPGVTDSTITIGTWAPLTGPAALWGAVGRGVDGYFRMLNDEEGGINGRRVNVIVRDDGYQPSRTVPAVREMAERDGVFAFVAGVGTAPGLAVKGYLEEQGIPWITPASGNLSFTHPPSHIIYSTFAPYVDEAATLVGYAVDTLGLSRLGVIYQNDDFGRSGVVGVEMALEQRGLKPVTSVPVEVTDADLSSHVLRLQEAKADGVLLWLTPRHAAIARNAAGRMNFRPQWFASTVLADISLMLEITNGAWAGTIGTTTVDVVDLDDPAVARYVAAMNRYSPDEGSVWFYIAGMSFAELAGEGLRRAGRDLTRERFLEEFAQMGDFKGNLAPPSHFDSEQHLGTRSMLLYRVTASAGEKLTDWIPGTLDL
jgi:branched-chain amino acid transport system substrate-binding protein